MKRVRGLLGSRQHAETDDFTTILPRVDSISLKTNYKKLEENLN